MSKLLEDLEQVLRTYSDMLWAELYSRWDAWDLDLSETEKFEVVGALLARQISLATQIALSPSIWNGHTAPVLLRTMVDTYIAFAWILKEPLERSRAFIRYGLGQEKLYLEHLKKSAAASDDNPEFEAILNSMESWISSQRFTFLTDVNVGSWTGLTVREMAIEAEESDLYRFAYQPFSAASHSMWNHVAKYNLRYCENPLHRHHRIPAEASTALHPDFLFRAAKYVQKMFNKFDEVFGIEVESKSAIDYLNSEFERFGESSELEQSIE